MIYTPPTNRLTTRCTPVICRVAGNTRERAGQASKRKGSVDEQSIRKNQRGESSERGPGRFSVPAPKYEPKPQERAAVEAWFDRRRQRAPAPRLKVEKKGSASQVALDHPHPETGSILLMAAVGTSSADFLQSLISQLVNAGTMDRTKLAVAQWASLDASEAAAEITL